MQPITNKEIEEITPLLLPSNCTFDDERKTFIKNLESIDCQAVPGSGKTTALLAKLLLLEKRLPLENGQGVLVLSHTNTAIEQLRLKLEKKCNFLFRYPNFVGTIQSFVDQFLAIPYYIQMYGHKPLYIDSDFAKKTTSCPANLARRLSRRPKSKDQILFQTGVLHNKLSYYDKKKFCYRECTDTYKAILNFKKSQYEKGILFYDDAYFLAQEYIEKYPEIINFLRLRFRYVFVDEMQDMNQTQNKLLEDLFNHSSVIYQRIGDINQSIFNEIKTDKIWEFRNTPLILHKTLRLPSEIAPIVERFSLYTNIDHRIVSIRKSNIPPYLFVYNSSSIGKVLEQFVQKIKFHNLQKGNAVFKGIAWVGHKKEGTVSLPTYYPSFQKENKTRTNYYDSLSEIIRHISQEAKSTLNFKPIIKLITQAFLNLLRLEKIHNPKTNTPYSYSSFWEKVKDSKQKDSFRQQTYSLCQKIYSSSTITISDFDCVLSDLKTIFEFQYSERSLNFRTNTSTQIMEAEDLPKNIFSLDGINIELGTIHSVKGETHTATLVMETQYHTTESQKILNILKGELINNPRPRQAEAMKMLYVAMSRPTDLLCFACNEKNIQGHEKEIEKSGWKIEKIS